MKLSNKLSSIGCMVVIGSLFAFNAQAAPDKKETELKNWMQQQIQSNNKGRYQRNIPLSEKKFQEALRIVNEVGVEVLEDKTLHLSNDQELLFADPIEDTASKSKSLKQAIRNGEYDFDTNVTLDEVFTLHSKPGSKNVIHLDFQGGELVNTGWNEHRPVLNYYPYSQDENFDHFSHQEIQTMAEIWNTIANNFAPFDVDITTEKPPEYNSRTGQAIFTYTFDRNGEEIYLRGGASGVAYLCVFGSSNYARYPSLTFAHPFSHSNDAPVLVAHSRAQVGTHEIGHNLCLRHDGMNPNSIYPGSRREYTTRLGDSHSHINWAPFMGIATSTALGQWSKGEYPGANNQQDDLQRIANYFLDVDNPNSTGYRLDDHADTRLNATPLSVENNGDISSESNYLMTSDLTNRGVIEGTEDIDWFSFETDGSRIDLLFKPYWNHKRDDFRVLQLSQGGEYRYSIRGSTLDIEVSLYNSQGQLLEVYDPNDDTIAIIETNLPAGKYYLRIDGVGNDTELEFEGSGFPHYTDYGSLGQYSISGSIDVPTDLELHSQLVRDQRLANGSYSVRHTIYNNGEYANEGIAVNIKRPTSGSQYNRVDYISNGQFNAGSNTWTLPTLAPGARASITLRYSNYQHLSAPKHYAEISRALLSDVDSITGNNSTNEDDDTMIRMNPMKVLADLNIRLEILSDQRKTNGRVTTRVTIKNEGVKTVNSSTIRLTTQTGARSTIRYDRDGRGRAITARTYWPQTTSDIRLYNLKPNQSRQLLITRNFETVNNYLFRQYKETAEVTYMSGLDADSTPNNAASVNEDDNAAYVHPMVVRPLIRVPPEVPDLCNDPRIAPLCQWQEDHHNNNPVVTPPVTPTRVFPIQLNQNNTIRFNW